MEFVPFHDALFVMGNSTSKVCMIFFKEVLDIFMLHKVLGDHFLVDKL
jgi:hypothetical protein